MRISIFDISKGRTLRECCCVKNHKRLEDDLPPVTLSIGIAFGDRENPGKDIYNDADKMLYKVKERGKNGFQFY